MFRFLLLPMFCGMLFAQRRPIDEAWNLAAKGERDQAVRLLQELTKNNPRDADARLLLGSLLQEAGERSASIEQLAEAVRLRPRSADAENALGEAYNAFGDKKAARAAFEKTVALDPGFAQGQANLGLVLGEAGEFVGSAEHLNRAIQRMGHTADSAYPRYLLAKADTAQNKVKEAAAQLQQAVALRPDFAEAWSDLGAARKTLLDDAGAMAAMKRAVELKPADAVAQYRLGSEYLRQNQTHLAVAHLQAAYRLDPDDQSTLNALQSALRRDGQAEEANKVSRSLADLLRQRDEARQNALSAVRINNQGAELQKSGDMRGAMEKYREALRLAPEHVGIRVNYAVALLRLGQWTDGLTQLHEALARDPNNAQIAAALKDAMTQAPPGTVPQWSEQRGALKH